MQIVSQEEFIWQTQGRTLSTINRSTCSDWLIDWLINCLPVVVENCCFDAAMEQSNIKLFEKFHKKDWVRWDDGWVANKHSKVKWWSSPQLDVQTNPLLSLDTYSNVYCCGFLKEAEQVVWRRTATPSAQRGLTNQLSPPLMALYGSIAHQSKPWHRRPHINYIIDMFVGCWTAMGPKEVPE